MPNEFIARNGIVSRGNLVVSGSVTSTSPASFSGSLTVTGSLNVVGSGDITQANGDGYLKIGNNGGGTIIENYNRTDLTLKANAILTTRGTGVTFRSTKGEPNGAILGVIGSGATSSTTSLLVQNANASSSLQIKDNGDSTFFYPGVAGYSLKISGSYSGNGASAIYETLGATGGYYGIHEFRIGTNTANALRAMSIVYGGRVVIGNKSDVVLQFPGANLFVDTNVINTFNNSTQAFNTGIIINPSGSLDTRFTASGIQFNFAANNPNDTNGGAFVGSQYNPATNGYDTDLVIYNSQHTAGSYVETARFVGKSKSLSLGAGRNPSASLHISGSSNSALFEIDSPAVNNIIFVSGSGNVGIGTNTPSYKVQVGDLASNNSNKVVIATLNSGVNGFYVYASSNIRAGIESDYGNTLTRVIGAYNGGTNIIGQDSNNGNTILYSGIFNTERARIEGSTGNVLIGTATGSARLTVKGSGTTSSTTALLVQNSTPTTLFQIEDGGTTRVTGPAPQLMVRVPSNQTPSPALTVGGNALFTYDGYSNAGGFYIDQSGTSNASRTIWYDGSGTPKNLITGNGTNYITSGNVGIGTSTPSASLHVVGNTILSGSAGSGSALLAYKSGSTVLDIQGSQGQLFSVLDALSGSLMSVNDISGLPILEVFSDDRVVMGTYGAPAVTISGSNTVISGSLRGRVVTLSTASATASMDCSLSNFFDLTLSGSMYLTPTNILPGETINLRITQPATSGSLNYTSSIKFPNGLPYTASATSSVVDLISFISFDSTTLYATAIKNLV